MGGPRGGVIVPIVARENVGDTYGCELSPAMFPMHHRAPSQCRLAYWTWPVLFRSLEMGRYRKINLPDSYSISFDHTRSIVTTRDGYTALCVRGTFPGKFSWKFLAKCSNTDRVRVKVIRLTLRYRGDVLSIWPKNANRKYY